MHKHWSFHAWNGDRKTTVFVTAVTVVGYESEEQALKQARLIIERESFELYQVYECTTCEFQKRHLGMASEMVAAMKS